MSLSSKLLENVRSILEESDEAASAPQADSPIDNFLSDAADAMDGVVELGVDVVLDLLFDVLDDFVSEGLLPELPDEELSAEQESAWVAAAQKAGLKDAALRAAKSYAGTSGDNE